MGCKIHHLHKNPHLLYVVADHRVLQSSPIVARCVQGLPVNVSRFTLNPRKKDSGRREFGWLAVQTNHSGKEPLQDSLHGPPRSHPSYPTGLPASKETTPPNLGLACHCCTSIQPGNPPKPGNPPLFFPDPQKAKASLVSLASLQPVSAGVSRW